MIIYKSQINIFKKGEEPKFCCELLVRNNCEGVDVVLIVKDDNDKYKIHNVNEFKDTYLYNYLSNLISEYEKYEISRDMEYLISIFEENHALNYIDIYTHSDKKNYEEKICDEEEIYANVTTFELNINKILKYILNLDEVTDLYTDSLRNNLEEYIGNKILEKIDFLKSIKVHRTYIGNEVIEIKKINKHNVFSILLNPLNDIDIKRENILGMDIAYIKGFSRYRKNGMHLKQPDFFEDSDGNEILIIANRKNYTVNEVIDLLYLDYFMYFGKLVIGVTNYENVKFIDEIE